MLHCQTGLQVVNGIKDHYFSYATGTFPKAFAAKPTAVYSAMGAGKAYHVSEGI